MYRFPLLVVLLILLYSLSFGQTELVKSEFTYDIEGWTVVEGTPSPLFM